jgi:hypothetical protein
MCKNGESGSWGSDECITPVVHACLMHPVCRSQATDGGCGSCLSCSLTCCQPSAVPMLVCHDEGGGCDDALQLALVAVVCMCMVCDQQAHSCTGCGPCTVLVLQQAHLLLAIRSCSIFEVHTNAAAQFRVLPVQ